MQNAPAFTDRFRIAPDAEFTQRVPHEYDAWDARIQECVEEQAIVTSDFLREFWKRQELFWRRMRRVHGPLPIAC